MHKHANVRLMLKGRLRLISHHLNDHFPRSTWPQRQGLPCAVLTSVGPAAEQAAPRLWLIEALFAALSGGHSILRTSSTLWSYSTRCCTRVISPRCWAPILHRGHASEPPWPSALRNLESKPVVQRYDHQIPGDLIHSDVKKLARQIKVVHRIICNRHQCRSIGHG